jgi:esterase FrsA
MLTLLDEPTNRMKNFEILRTPGGIRFGLLGNKGPTPGPTVFAFAGSVEDALTLPQFNRCGLLLHEQGCLCVSVDLPCYAEDVRPGDSGDASGTLVTGDWRRRLEKGEDLMQGFVTRASSVLSHLIAEEFTDPAKVAAYGISRGAFAALHLAARDPRVRSIAGIAPLVDFLALREFAGLENHAGARAQALVHHASRLAGRSIWLSIGNNDDRVDTDRVVAFARAVTKTSFAANEDHSAGRTPVDVELHVCPSIGHSAPAHSDEMAAAWILKKLK